MKPVDEIVLARHRSGFGFTLTPRLSDGKLALWAVLRPHRDFMPVQLMICGYQGRASFARWLRRAAERVENA